MRPPKVVLRLALLVVGMVGHNVEAEHDRLVIRALHTLEDWVLPDVLEAAAGYQEMSDLIWSWLYCWCCCRRAGQGSHQGSYLSG